ncbi:MAG: CDP-alcohol phosphatidyltransferase family protein [Bacteroidota bacterium]|nr:CDP-alcohol phosphatidyltransferase family protein [Bacteroidota bacterium]
MKWLRHLPNVLTLINLTAGTLAVIAMTNTLIPTALGLMGVCLVADILDGQLARKLGVAGGIGVQLDSLADVVSFGVLPCMMIFYMGARYGGGEFSQQFVGVLAALTVASAGLRLARFNVDTRDKKYFWGLATPAGAMLIAGWLWAQYVNKDFGFSVAEMPFLIILIPVIVMVAYHLPLKLPGLKSPKKAITIAIILFAAIAIGVFTIGPISIPLGLLLYLLLGVINLGLKIY